MSLLLGIHQSKNVSKSLKTESLLSVRRQSDQKVAGSISTTSCTLEQEAATSAGRETSLLELDFNIIGWVLDFMTHINASGSCVSVLTIGRYFINPSV